MCFSFSNMFVSSVFNKFLYIFKSFKRLWDILTEVLVVILCEVCFHFVYSFLSIKETCNTFRLCFQYGVILKEKSLYFLITFPCNFFVKESIKFVLREVVLLFVFLFSLALLPTWQQAFWNTFHRFPIWRPAIPFGYLWHIVFLVEEFQRSSWLKKKPTMTLEKLRRQRHFIFFLSKCMYMCKCCVYIVKKK